MFFKKKKEDEEPDTSEEAAEDTNMNSSEPISSSSSSSSMDEPSLGRLTADVEKLKAQFSTFFEMQKSSNERFSSINEQIGSLRGMLTAGDKEVKLMQAKATQAIDLVQSVQPDKLMMENKKMDNKIELLKSPVQTNEIMIGNAMNELKDMRSKLSAFKGIEEAVKLSDEVKKDWLENKKLDANITKHASKVEMIYSEMWKEFSEFKKFSSRVGDVDKSVKQVSSDIDSIKVKITSFASKKEVESLITKFDSFEKHVNNLVFTLNNRISSFEAEFTDNFNKNMEKSKQLLTGFETLAAKTPDLDKYFNLLSEEAKKVKTDDVKVEKVKTPGADEKIEVTEKKGMFGKIMGKFGK